MLIVLAVLIATYPIEAKAACGRVTVQGRGATQHQRLVLSVGLDQGKSMKAPRSALVAYVAATTVETRARNLRYGHGSSVGHLQLIDAWGSVAERMRVRYSAAWFFRRANSLARRYPLVRAGVLAQMVQRSAFPYRYQVWAAEASRTVGRCG